MSVGAVEEQESTESTESEDTESQDTGAPEENTPVDNPSRPTRAERRGERAAEHNARAEAAALRKELETERERIRGHEASIAEMRGYMTAQQQRQAPTDDTDAKIAKLEDEADRHLINASTAKHPEIAKEEMRQYKLKLRQAAVMDSKREFSAEFDKLRASSPNPQQAATQNQLMTEFPWIGTDSAAATFAGALEEAMIKAGKPPGMATARAALAEAAKRLGIGGRTAPANGARNAYAGVSSREGAGAEGNGQGGGKYQATSMSREEKRLAEQAFPKLEPALAHNAWARKMNAYFAKQGQ